MKQIPFYQGISKKVVVSGPAIIDGQWYKCVVYSKINDDTTKIETIAKGKSMPKPPCTPDCAPSIGTVEFNFTEFQTVNLALGDNNLAVYDIMLENDDTDYTLYKVYEARVLAADSVVNHKTYDALDFDYESNNEGSLVLGRMVDGYIILNNGETIDANGYIQLTTETEPES